MSDNTGTRTDLRTDSMNQTRRQTLLTLGGAAVGAGSYGYGSHLLTGEPPFTGQSDGESPSRYHSDAILAVAEAVYPSSVSVDRSFVENYVFGRVEPQPDHFEHVLAAVEAVDDYAQARFGNRITELPADRRRQVLQSMGATEVHPTPDGTTAERVRFYLVNDLLYALLTSPASSDLTGIDNPPGYPGGRDAYQQAPGGGEQ